MHPSLSYGAGCMKEEAQQKKIIIQSLSAKEGSNFFNVGFQIDKILTIRARIARIASSVSSC
jgi:hypothetical protein